MNWKTGLSAVAGIAGVGVAAYVFRNELGKVAESVSKGIDSFGDTSWVGQVTDIEKWNEMVGNFWDVKDMVNTDDNQF